MYEKIKKIYFLYILFFLLSQKKKQYNMLGINERSKKKAVPNRAKSAKSCPKKNL